MYRESTFLCDLIEILDQSRQILTRENPQSRTSWWSSSKGGLGSIPGEETRSLVLQLTPDAAK